MANHGSAEEKTPAAQGSPPVEILEKGEIFFFYRPKVDLENPTSMNDVQKMYMVIKPEKGKRDGGIKQSHQSGKESTTHDVDDDKKPATEDAKGGITVIDHGSAKEEDTKQDEQEGKRVELEKLEKGRHGGEGEEKVSIATQEVYRFIILGRKSLPDASKRTRPSWGFVDLVTTSMDDIKQALGADEYETATRGKRHKPAARPAGEGVYNILQHKKGSESHTHLVYKLELPKADTPNSPQSELNIEEEGSFIIQVKNPNQSAPPNIGLGNKRRATYPAHLQSNMGHYRFVAADPCDYLNYEGCEFILISASDDLEEELGIHLDVKHDESCPALLSLLGSKSPLNVKPLMEGEWA